MWNNNLVSVIIPTFNRSTYLSEAIDSVIDQTYQNIEIIVVDDGSDNDGEATKEVLKPYMDSLTYIFQQNQGIGAAVNKGLSLARGEFIQRLDDDDLLEKEKIEKSVEAFQRNPNAGIVVTGCHVIDEQRKCIKTDIPLRYPKKARVIFMLMTTIFAQVSAIVRKTCHDDVGLYRTDILSEDYEMWVRIARKYEIETVDKPLASYRRHSENITRNTERLERDTFQFIRQYLEEIPMDELIPGIQSEAYGNLLKSAVYLAHDGIRVRTVKMIKEKWEEALRLAPNEPLIRLWELVLIIHGDNSVILPENMSIFGEFQTHANILLELISEFQKLKVSRPSPSSPQMIDFRRRYGKLKSDLIKESYRRAITG